MMSQGLGDRRSSRGCATHSVLGALPHRTTINKYQEIKYPGGGTPNHDAFPKPAATPRPTRPHHFSPGPDSRAIAPFLAGGNSGTDRLEAAWLKRQQGRDSWGTCGERRSWPLQPGPWGVESTQLDPDGDVDEYGILEGWSDLFFFLESFSLNPGSHSWLFYMKLIDSMSYLVFYRNAIRMSFFPTPFPSNFTLDTFPILDIPPFGQIPETKKLVFLCQHVTMASERKKEKKNVGNVGKKKKNQMIASTIGSNIC